MSTRLHPFFKQSIIISVAPSWSPLPANRSSSPFSGRKNSNVHSFFILFYFLPVSRLSAGTEIRGPLHRCERAPCKTRLARMEKRQGPTPSRPAEPCLSLLTICQVSVSFGIRPVSAIGSRPFQSLLFGIPYQCQRSRPDRGVPRLMPGRKLPSPSQIPLNASPLKTPQSVHQVQGVTSLAHHSSYYIVDRRNCS